MLPSPIASSPIAVENRAFVYTTTHRGKLKELCKRWHNMNVAISAPFIALPPLLQLFQSKKMDVQGTWLRSDLCHSLASESICAYQRSKTKDQRSRTRDQGQRIKNQGPGIKDQRARTKDQRSRTGDQWSMIENQRYWQVWEVIQGRRWRRDYLHISACFVSQFQAVNDENRRRWESRRPGKERQICERMIGD